MSSVPQVLSTCCPRAEGGSYGYPLCACPAGVILWQFDPRAGSMSCGIREFAPRSSPPKLYQRVAIAPGGTWTRQVFNSGGGVTDTSSIAWSGACDYVFAVVDGVPTCSVEGGLTETLDGWIGAPSGQFFGGCPAGGGSDYDATLAGIFLGHYSGTVETGGSTSRTYAITHSAPFGGGHIEINGAVTFNLSEEITETESIDAHPEGYADGTQGGVDDPWQFGPLWRARETGYDYLWRDAWFAVLARNLVPGWTYKVVLSVFRRPYAENGDLGEVEELDGIELEFTAGAEWALVGAAAPEGFNPDAFSIADLFLEEQIVPTNELPQGYAYAAVLESIEPVNLAL